MTLVMTMLVALGIFAARATSLSGRAAGYLRQGEQTHYLLQHAMTLTLSEVDQNAAVYADPNPNNPVNNQVCSSTINNPGVRIPCSKFSTDPATGDGSGSFGKMVATAQGNAGLAKVPPLSVASTKDLATAVPGSLGPWPLLPGMYVEMTDKSQIDRPPAGTAVSGAGAEFQYMQATLVAWGQVGPYPANGPTASCTDVSEQGAALVVSREAGRGQIIFGPVPKPEQN
ncbi:MAG: hypothetical protein EOO75_00205 [Myxococcales bacterium]|nr:MAG: hypothetical protein EOO75_00205 [Myxococcales bacterium]